jgi:hypothetical protein
MTLDSAAAAFAKQQITTRTSSNSRINFTSDHMTRYMRVFPSI